MRVAFICISHKGINKSSVGGIETFSLYLLNALKRVGAEITVFSSSDIDQSILKSIKTDTVFESNELQKTEGENTETKVFSLNYAMFQYAGLSKVLGHQQKNFDIIHFSCAQWYIPLLLSRRGDIPIVTTVHVNNLKEKPLAFLLKQEGNVHIVNISEASSKPFISYKERETIYNGIEIDQFPFREHPDSYFAWLGRIAPVKGLREAFQAAHLADVECIASGSIDYTEYFEKEVKPLLDNKRKLIASLATGSKGKFLSRAKAVLLPVRWDEPFGLVAIEAMACGTPVIAFDRGGLSETIIDGKTGFLVHTVEEMVQRMNEIDKIKRSDCRKHVERHYSSSVMAKNYYNYYQEILSKKQ